MVSSTENPPKFKLDLTIESHIDERYQPYLVQEELVRGINTSFNLVVTNKSSKIFPGCTLSISFEEYGELTSPLGWHLVDPIVVRRLRRDQQMSAGFSFPPLVNGVMRIVVKITSVTGKDNNPKDVELRGYRYQAPEELYRYFHVVPRESLDIRPSLDQLLAK